MKMNPLLFGALLVSATFSKADIGDTLQSSQVKYGQPVAGIGNQHEVVYNYNGCRISETYNNNGICVAATFARLDGKQFSKAVVYRLDAANLPPMVLNAQGNGWLYQNWQDMPNVRTATCWTWNNGITSFQVVDAQVRFGNDTKWRWSREYFTPEGWQVIQADNAVNAAAKAANTADQSDPTKTSI